jgi:hypothetical protein
MGLCVQKKTVMNNCYTERDKFMVSYRAFISKITGTGTQTNIFLVNIMLWVPSVVPTSVKLLRTFKLPISSTLVRLSQYMSILNLVIL